MIRPTMKEMRALCPDPERPDRYLLAVASARAARRVTDEASERRREEEARREAETSAPLYDSPVSAPPEENAVSVAIRRLESGRYKIVAPSLPESGEK